MFRHVSYNLDEIGMDPDYTCLNVDYDEEVPTPPPEPLPIFIPSGGNDISDYKAITDFAPRDVNRVIQFFADRGVMTSYTPFTTQLPDINCDAEITKLSVDITKEVKFDQPMPPMAGPQIRTFQDLVFQDDACTEELVDRIDSLVEDPIYHEATKIMSTPPIPSFVDGNMHLIKSDTKAPALHVLNAVMSCLIHRGGRKKLRALLWGCGDGVADMRRIHIANENTRGTIIVDLFDPLEQYAPYVRSIFKKHKIPGTNLKGNTRDFGTEVYDIVLAFNNIHYSAVNTGKDHPLLEALLRCVKTDGFVVGMFPSFHGISSLAGNTDGDIVPESPYISLLAVESRDDGVVMMKTRVWGIDYYEPVLDPSFLTEFMFNANFIGHCVNSTDVRSVLPSRFKSLVCDSKYPEVAAFNTFFFQKKTSAYFEFPNSHQYVPLQVRLERGDFNPDDWKDFLPTVVEDHGVALSGIEKWKFVNGGPYYFAEKSDGISALVVSTSSRVVLFSKGYKPVVLLQDTNLVPVVFQVELLRFNDTLDLFVGVVTRVLDSVGFHNVFKTDSKNSSLTFGEGMLFGKKIWNSSALSLFREKSWTMDAIFAIENCHEGLVIAKFEDPPPPPVHNAEIFKICASKTIYVKRRWTIDIAMTSSTCLLKFNGGTRSLALKVPIADFSPGVYEFTTDGEYVQRRDTKTKGNSNYVLRKILGAISWNFFERYVVKRYYIKWKNVETGLDFLMNDPSTWTNFQLMILAVSYPRGMVVIKDKSIRMRLENLRHKFYHKGMMDAYQTALAHYSMNNYHAMHNYGAVTDIEKALNDSERYYDKYLCQENGLYTVDPWVLISETN